MPPLTGPRPGLSPVGLLPLPQPVPLRPVWGPCLGLAASLVDPPVREAWGAPLKGQEERRLRSWRQTPHHGQASPGLLSLTFLEFYSFPF